MSMFGIQHALCWVTLDALSCGDDPCALGTPKNTPQKIATASTQSTIAANKTRGRVMYGEEDSSSSMSASGSGVKMRIEPLCAGAGEIFRRRFESLENR